MNKLFISGFILFLILLFFMGIPFYIVDPGYTALHMRLGTIIATQSQSGIYFKQPFIDSVTYIDCRIQNMHVTTEAFSHDLQTVDIEIALNYRVINAQELYRNIGMNYENIVITPLTQENVKAIVARFSAEELTQQRNTAKDMVKKELTEALKRVYIELVDFNFIHVDFHADFIKAVEGKQIAEQYAKKAKFATDQVLEEAKQTKIAADAKAYTMKAQKQEITDKYIEMKKIEKWDGKLPQIVTGNGAIFDLSNLQ